MAGDPAYPEGDDLPLPALPLGDGVIDVVRAHDRLGWHWWPAPNAILSAPYRGRHPVRQWGSCMQGCPEGAKASTDITHWPEAIEHGARVITGARVTRVVMGPDRLATGAEYLDRAGRANRIEAGRDRARCERHRHGSTPAAVGLTTSSRTGSQTRAASSGAA